MHITDETLRPRSMAEYAGQGGMIGNLRVAMDAARRRGEPLDHTLLYGPPGLGKTTIAHAIANEMRAQIHTTSGPAITKPADLVSLIINLRDGDVLFIDEIHRLMPAVEEILYPAMEDRQVDILIGQGFQARALKLPVAHFTLVGATTRTGMMTAPLRARFGMTFRLEFYSTSELTRIVMRSARILKAPIEANAAMNIAARSRGTPRVANWLLRRVRDYAQVRAAGVVTEDVTGIALDMMGVDELGLNATDRRMLQVIMDVYGGGPVGLDAIATSINEDRGTVEDVNEPFLIHLGFIGRTPRGRIATDAAYQYMGRG